MSYFPQIYNRLYANTRNITATASNVQLLMESGGAATPSSIVVPVMSTTLSAFTNNIFMDHPRLPPMQEFTIGDTTVNAHSLGNDEFMYVCYNQFAQGAFHLIGAPGLFSLGFSSLAVSPGPVPDMIVDVIRSDMSSSFSMILRPYEHRNVFLGQGDSFRVLCTLPEDAESQALDGLQSRFVITRISRNPDYTHPITILA
jgi:hypothetical protein